jgi:hypothetical protein
MKISCDDCEDGVCLLRILYCAARPCTSARRSVAPPPPPPPLLAIVTQCRLLTIFYFIFHGCTVVHGDDICSTQDHLGEASNAVAFVTNELNAFQLDEQGAGRSEVATAASGGGLPTLPRSSIAAPAAAAALSSSAARLSGASKLTAYCAYG